MDTLHVSLDTSELMAALDEPSFQKLFPGVVDFFHISSGVGVVEINGLATASTRELRLCAKPSHRLAMLVAAARTGDLNSGIIEQLLGHETSRESVAPPLRSNL